MWSLTIAAGIIFRAQLQDTLSDVTYNPTILDITSSGQGASRWIQLCFKVRTADLHDFDLGSTVVAFPSKEFAVDVQQALIETKVHRFALFLAPGVPCVLDIGSDTRFECVNLLLPGTLAFRPELRGSIKATSYQNTVRIIFFNCRIGSSITETSDGQEFMSIPPLPALKHRCFTLQLGEEAKRENNRRIERLAQIAAHAAAAVKVAPREEAPLLQLADVPSCVAILGGLELHFTTTRELPTTTTASILACAKYLAKCHDKDLATLLVRVGAKIAKHGSQRQQASAVKALRHAYDTDRCHRESTIDIVIETLIGSTDNDK
jgi:hypothetical protein